MTSIDARKDLGGFISRRIKDGKIKPVLKAPLLKCTHDIHHGIATKNKKKLVQAIQELCDLLTEEWLRLITLVLRAT